MFAAYPQEVLTKESSLQNPEAWPLETGPEEVLARDQPEEARTEPQRLTQKALNRGGPHSLPSHSRWETRH